MLKDNYQNFVKEAKEVRSWKKPTLSEKTLLTCKRVSSKHKICLIFAKYHDTGFYDPAEDLFSPLFGLSMQYIESHGSQATDDDFAKIWDALNKNTHGAITTNYSVSFTQTPFEVFKSSFEKYNQMMYPGVAQYAYNRYWPQYRAFAKLKKKNMV